MLNEINETFGGRRSHGFRILVVGGKPRGENVCQRNSIVTNDGNILRDSQPRLPDGVQAAQGGKIIRKEDAAGAVGQGEQLFRDLRAGIGPVIEPLADNGLIRPEAQFLTGPVETRKPVLGNGGALAVDKGDAPGGPGCRRILQGPPCPGHCRRRWPGGY